MAIGNRRLGAVGAMNVARTMGAVNVARTRSIGPVLDDALSKIHADTSRLGYPVSFLKQHYLARTVE